MNSHNKYFIIPYADILKSNIVRKYHLNGSLAFEVRRYSIFFLFVFFSESSKISKVIVLTETDFAVFDDRDYDVNTYLNHFGYACIVH